MPPRPRIPPARRRRRQLLFWDKETQISREKFQEQLQTRAHCWECVSAAQVLQGRDKGREAGREGLGPCILGLLISEAALGSIPREHVLQVYTCSFSDPHSPSMGTS